MARLDYAMYAATQDSSGGPVIQYIDDEPPAINLEVDAEGNPTRSSLLAYGITYAAAFAIVAYFLLV